LQPVLNPFREIAHSGYFSHLLASRPTQKNPDLSLALIVEARKKIGHLLDGLEFVQPGLINREKVVTGIELKLAAVLELPFLSQKFHLPSNKLYKQAWHYLVKPLDGDKKRWYILFGFVFLHNLGKLGGETEGATLTLSWMGEWQLGKILQETYTQLGFDDNAAWSMTNTVRLLITQQNWYSQAEKLPLEKVLSGWLSQEEIRAFTGINRYKDILWFNREAFDDFVWWMDLLAVLEFAGEPESSAASFVEQVLGAHEMVRRLLKAEKESEFQVSKLLSGSAERTKPSRG